jgi:hypothetical protein
MHKPPYVDLLHIPTWRKVATAYVLWLLGCVVFGVPTALVMWVIWRWL